MDRSISLTLHPVKSHDTAPTTTNTTPPTLSRVPTTSIGLICSSRCRNMWARTRVISGLLALIGLTTVTGARLKAWNKKATAKPWLTPARQQIATYLVGRFRKLFITSR